MSGDKKETTAVLVHAAWADRSSWNKAIGFIAFVAAGVYYLAGLKLTALYKEPVKWGLAYGVLVYFFMNYVVLPLSAVPKSPFSFGLLLNGVIGHAIFVGFAIAWFAHRSATAR